MRIIPIGSGITVPVGPFLSNTDFKTPQTALASSSGNLLLFAGGVYGDISSRSFTHIAGGTYALSLLASDITTAGSFVIEGIFPSAVPKSFEFQGVSANFYSALSGAGLMGVNASAVGGSVQAATNLSQGGLAVVPFTVQSGSSNTTLNTNLTSVTSANYNGRTVIFISGTLAGQGASITGYNGSTLQLTVTALTGAPNPGDTAVIV